MDSASARQQLACPMGSMNGLESHSTSTPKNAATLPRFNCETYVRSRPESERGKAYCDLTERGVGTREGERDTFVTFVFREISVVHAR